MLSNRIAVEVKLVAHPVGTSGNTLVIDKNLTYSKFRVLVSFICKMAKPLQYNHKKMQPYRF